MGIYAAYGTAVNPQRVGFKEIKPLLALIKTNAEGAGKQDILQVVAQTTGVILQQPLQNQLWMKRIPFL